MQPFDQPRHLGFGVGREHDERHGDAPIGGVGHVRHARQAVELDVVLRGASAQALTRRPAQVVHLAEARGKVVDRPARRRQQFVDQRIPLGIVLRLAALLDLVQAMVHRLDQRGAALRVVDQIVFEIGVSLHCPDVAQHLVQHAGRAPGAALAAELLREVPRAVAEQALDDLAVGERRVVVGDLAQARGVVERVGRADARPCGGNGKRCVHRAWIVPSGFRRRGPRAAHDPKTPRPGCPASCHITPLSHGQANVAAKPFPPVPET